MKTIGIVGGGQLGKMLADSAHKLGFKVIVLDPTPESPAGQVADEQIVGGFKDPEKIRELASKSDVVTFEIESADAETLFQLQRDGKEIHPSPETLSIIKDKFAQKKFLSERGISVADSLEVNSEDEARKAGESFGYLLKARFDAYDGRGNAFVKSELEINDAFHRLGAKNLYAEKRIDFEKEISAVASRGIKGEIKVFPIVETVHKNNICHEVIAPAQINEGVREKADKMAAKVLEVLEGVGVFGIEMFVTKAGEVLVNEIAPRVHNSGHHTIEANKTSQFEQHIRAVTGMDLGDTHMVVPSAVMINILGERNGKAIVAGSEILKELENVFMHIYGKVETKVLRKMGHITALGNTPEEALQKARKAKKHISI